MTSENLKSERINSDEISLRDVLMKIQNWFRYISSKWLLLCIVGCIGGILGFTYAWFKKPVYSAVTTFVLEEEKSSGGGLGSLAGLASIAGVDLGSGGGGIFQGDNILELYKSRNMIQRTLLTPIIYDGKEELLIDRYIEFNDLRNKWKKKDGLDNIRFFAKQKLTRIQDSLIGVIVIDINKNYLNVVKPDKKLSIIRAEVRANNEFFAKTFNNEIVKNVNDFYIQTKTKKSLDNVMILQQKTDSVRRVMNGDIYKAAAVVDATPNLNATRLTQRMAPVQRSQFSAETNKAILSELVKNLEMSKMSLVKETPLIQVVDEPIFPLAKDLVNPFKGVILGIVISSLILIFLLTVRAIIKAILK